MTTTPKEQAAAEALRLAKDAILHAYGCYPPPYKTDSVTVKSRKALEAIEEALASAPSPAVSAEPVAWRDMGPWMRDFLAQGERFVRVLYNEPVDAINLSDTGDWIQTASQLLQRISTPTPPAEPSKVDGVWSDRQWLLALMGEHDFAVPNAAFEALVKSLSTHPKAEPAGVPAAPQDKEADRG